jgi:LysR family transcriptional regulator for bpeEF and oprC
MHGLQQLAAFAETARHGSFAAAARTLGTAPSTLAKSVGRLERSLGLRLFHRTTRQVTLTDDGRRLFQRCERVLAELEALQEEASGARTAPAGTLRIDMPAVFGRQAVMPVLARLLEAHPALSVDARFSDTFVDLVREGLDLAIRIGPLADSTLVARRFASQTLKLVASPAYLARAGAPHGLQDLAAHRHIVFSPPGQGRDRPLRFRSGRHTVELQPTPRLRLDDGEAMVDAAVIGLGLAQVPDYMAAAPLADGRLVELLPGHRPPAVPIHAVMPANRLVPARVRVVLDALVRWGRDEAAADTRQAGASRTMAR